MGSEMTEYRKFYQSKWNVNDDVMDRTVFGRTEDVSKIFSQIFCDSSLGVQRNFVWDVPVELTQNPL